MDIQGMWETARPMLITFGLKALGAIAVFIVGRMLIGFASRLVVGVLERQKVDATVTRYVASILSVALNIILVVAILGYFGVETTSFAALVAGARHRGRGGMGRAPVEFRVGRVHPRAAAVQGRRLRRRRRGRGHGASDRSLQHDHRHARQRADDGRQFQDHERDDQEFQPQPVPPRGSHRPARPQRRSRRRRAPA